MLYSVLRRQSDRQKRELLRAGTTNAKADRHSRAFPFDSLDNRLGDHTWTFLYISTDWRLYGHGTTLRAQTTLKLLTPSP